MNEKVIPEVNYDDCNAPQTGFTNVRALNAQWYICQKKR
jgi:hypothetical protein